MTHLFSGNVKKCANDRRNILFEQNPRRNRQSLATDANATKTLPATYLQLVADGGVIASCANNAAPYFRRACQLDKRVNACQAAVMGRNPRQAVNKRIFPRQITKLYLQH